MGHHQPRIEFIELPTALNKGRLVKVLVSATKEQGREVENLLFNFVPREKIREINRAHLNHDYDTDIITFDYSKGSRVSAEIYICPDVVAENAKDLKIEVGNELVRVVFHGLLHLVGFNDKEVAGRKEMRNAEDRCLKTYSLRGDE